MLEKAPITPISSGTIHWDTYWDRIQRLRQKSAHIKQLHSELAVGADCWALVSADYSRFQGIKQRNFIPYLRLRSKAHPGSGITTALQPRSELKVENLDQGIKYHVSGK
jgi:hypothetical protein